MCVPEEGAAIPANSPRTCTVSWTAFHGAQGALGPLGQVFILADKTAPMWETWSNSGRLAPTWLSFSPRSHLGSELMHGRSLSDE